MLLTDEEIFKVVFGKEPIDKEWVNSCLPLYRDKIAKAQLNKLHKWGNETCTCKGDYINIKRRQCDECWQSLLKEIEW